MNRISFSLESLESRMTPATISGFSAIASGVASLPSIELTGPLGGTLTGSVDIEGNTIHESLVYVGPQGNTVLTETAVLKINPISGAVSGTIEIIGPRGQVVSGVLTGVLTDNSFTETTTLTGPRGKTVTQEGVYVGGTSSVTSTAKITGPNGKTIERNGVLSFGTTSGTVSVEGTITGPNGRTFEYSPTIQTQK